MSHYNKLVVILLVIVGIFGPLCHQSFLTYQEKNYDSLTNIALSQGGINTTISTFFPKLIWMEGNLQLEITPNQTGQVLCDFREISESAFTSYNSLIDIVNVNHTQVFIIKVSPYITTLPGVYMFRLNLTGMVVYYEEFEVIFAIGFLPLILIFGVGLISIISILIRKNKGTEKVQEEIQITDVSSPLIGKIKCPSCRKQIQEGLTFCPECGDRIPEFLRYNPVSGG